MPTIDQDTTFPEFEQLLREQKEVSKELEKTFKSKDTLKRIMQRADSLVEDNPLLSPIVLAVFGPGSLYNKWVDGQKNELLRFKNNEHGIREHQPSAWLNQQRHFHTHHEPAAALVEQLIVSEREAVQSALGAHILLEEWLLEPKIKPQDKALIKQYIEGVDALKSAYYKLNLHQLLNPTNSLETAASALAERYNGPEYNAYQQALDKLVLLGSKVMHLEHPNSSLKTAFIHSNGILMKHNVAYPKSLSALKQKMDEVGIHDVDLVKAISTAQARKAEFDATLAIDQQLSQFAPQTHERKTLALRTIMTIDRVNSAVNYPDGPDRALQIQHYQSTYLKLLLSEAMPNMFKRSSDNISTVKAENTSINILDALGVNETNTLLDPARFNADALGRLHSTTHKPIWAILKMIKPVDNSFTARNKIQAYLDVFHLTKIGELKFDNQPPLEQARLIAADFKTFAAAYFKAHPDDALGRQAFQKAAETIKEQIESSALTKAFKKGIQIISGQDPTTLPTHEKTIQRQYRDLIEGRTDIANYDEASSETKKPG